MKVHFVWCTKYRYKIIEGQIALRCRELIRQGC
ncbi:MAG: transposase, partial [Clostridia bacterium]|nr:transposase [Clostridia bacterium]